MKKVKISFNNKQLIKENINGAHELALQAARKVCAVACTDLEYLEQFCDTRESKINWGDAAKQAEKALANQKNININDECAAALRSLKFAALQAADTSFQNLEFEDIPPPPPPPEPDEPETGNSLADRSAEIGQKTVDTLRDVGQDIADNAPEWKAGLAQKADDAVDWVGTKVNKGTEKIKSTLNPLKDMEPDDRKKICLDWYYLNDEQGYSAEGLSEYCDAHIPSVGTRLAHCSAITGDCGEGLRCATIKYIDSDGETHREDIDGDILKACIEKKAEPAAAKAKTKPKQPVNKGGRKAGGRPIPKEI